MRKLARYQEPAYAALRIVSGGMFLFHGLQKLFGVFGHGPVHFGNQPQAFVGGVIELVCGLAIAVGLFTRGAAFLASGTMAVAYFQFHFKGEASGGHWAPIVNQGELAVLYCFVFLYVFFRGPGLASLDRRFKLDA
jgi:putative oxidoreductase